MNTIVEFSNYVIWPQWSWEDLLQPETIGQVFCNIYDLGFVISGYVLGYVR